MINKTILLVDDNQNNIRLLKDILSDENYEIYSADNGAPVLEMARTLKPDVILLDIMMPGLDGYEVCKLLKNDPDVNDIPIIMVTAKIEASDLKKALEYGAFDYIKKPIDEIELLARVQSALRFKEQQDILKESATKDSLTGLYNHALLIELFDKELAKQQRAKGCISFIMLDIDNFKNVNDTYGHTTGDIVLREISFILLDSVREGDIVGRYGGEEFGMVIPEIKESDVLFLCERIRKTIEAKTLTTGNKNINITISIGVCHKSEESILSASYMVQKADEALYRAKRLGRNKVERYIP